MASIPPGARLALESPTVRRRRLPEGPRPTRDAGPPIGEVRRGQTRRRQLMYLAFALDAPVLVRAVLTTGRLGHGGVGRRGATVLTSRAEPGGGDLAGRLRGCRDRRRRGRECAPVLGGAGRPRPRPARAGRRARVVEATGSTHGVGRRSPVLRLARRLVGRSPHPSHRLGRSSSSSSVMSATSSRSGRTGHEAC